MKLQQMMYTTLLKKEFLMWYADILINKVYIPPFTKYKGSFSHILCLMSASCKEIQILSPNFVAYWYCYCHLEISVFKHG